jgi:hypothetical protein
MESNCYPNISTRNPMIISKKNADPIPGSAFLNSMN